MKTTTSFEGESAVIMGKCLRFFPSEITLSDDFIRYLKRGYGALLFTHVLHMVCKLGVPTCGGLHISPSACSPPS